MIPIGLHFGLIEAAEAFANLQEIDETEIDQLFDEAFVSGLPLKPRKLVRALKEYADSNEYFELNRFVNGFDDSFFDGPINEGLLLYFKPSKPWISQAWSDEDHDFSGEKTVTKEDYAEEQMELRRHLASLSEGKSLSAFRPATTLRTISGHAMITPSGVNAFFVVPSVHAAWVLAIHMLTQRNSKGVIHAHGKIFRCPVRKPRGRKGEICGNYIIDVAPRGRRPRKYCSKRCATRRHLRKKRRDPPGLGDAI